MQMNNANNVQEMGTVRLVVQTVNQLAIQCFYSRSLFRLLARTYNPPRKPNR